MKYTSLTINIVLSLFVVSFAFAQTRPARPPLMLYEPEAWNDDPYPYVGFQYPDSGIVAYTDIGFNEPLGCYPLRSGSVRGVSDTISVCVYIENLDTIDFNISLYSPEDWFMPEVYDVNLDPRVFSPMADTSTLTYSFKGWYIGIAEPVTTPDYIYKNRGKGGKPTYNLKFNVWGTPLGKIRLLMVETAEMPTSVNMLTNYVRPRVVKEPNFMKDTLNAYGACFWRSYDSNDYTASLAWCDTMLYLNSSCIPAYYLKSIVYKYDAQNDSLAELTALDSTIAILNRFGDPAMGDTSTWIIPEWNWYGYTKQMAVYRRWKVINGERGLMGL